jgi:hypothetical protein
MKKPKDFFHQIHIVKERFVIRLNGKSKIRYPSKRKIEDSLCAKAQNRNKAFRLRHNATGVRSNFIGR